MLAAYPSGASAPDGTEAQMSELMGLVTAIRTVRSEYERRSEEADRRDGERIT